MQKSMSTASGGDKIRFSFHDEPTQRSRLGKCAYVFKKIYKKFALRHLIPLAIILIYMVLGAVVFHLIEYPVEKARKQGAYADYISEKEKFMKRIKEIKVDLAAKGDRLDEMVTEAVNYYENKINFTISRNLDWGFLSSMYYAGTVYTTIGDFRKLNSQFGIWRGFAGYGDIVCATAAGQLVTVIYAIIGIPLMLTALNDLGKWLFKLIKKSLQYSEDFKRFIARYCCCCSKRIRDRLTQKKNRSAAAALVASTIVDRPAKMSIDAEEIFGGSPMQRSQQPSMEIIVEEGSISQDRPPPDPNPSKSENMLQVPPVTFDLVPDQDLEKGGQVGEKEAVGTDGERSLTETSDMDMEDIDEGPPPRIPVPVALFVTIGWLFFCAALFCTWERRWTYWESCYFFVISLLTIGLGDVVPDRKDLMVSAFVFVIIGLSLVSMCINVIQGALEDLYMQLLMKILLDYQKKIAEGNDEVNASMGMMQMWSANKSAKFLMPLLSKEKKEHVAKKFQEEAKEQGIELPPVLSQIDADSGLPAILALERKRSRVSEREFPLQQMLEETIQHAEYLSAPQFAQKRSVASVQQAQCVTLPPSLVNYDATVQTELLEMVEKSEQTYEEECFTIGVQTDMCMDSNVDDCSQTDELDLRDADTQSNIVYTVDEDVQTVVVTLSDVDCQTAVVSTSDQELQTRIADLSDDAQMQTDPPFIQHSYAQTWKHWKPVKDVTLTDSWAQTELPVRSQVDSAKRRFRRAFGRHSLKEPGSSSGRRGSLRPAERGHMLRLGNVEDVEEVVDEEEEEEMSEEEEESLHWDPVDGMHAEKQRPVSKLKQMFEKQHSTQTESAPASPLQKRHSVQY